MRGKKLVVGILAHVDAGKTTLAESILHRSGAIRSLGRVDHRDTFLDTDSRERDRGITIFSKQALFSWRDMEVTLMDTPGHADFSAEMERTLQILDYAVLVVSGADGVQGHVPTLWRLLGRYHIPTFLFVNKMDQPGTDEAALMTELRGRLDARCVSFGVRDAAFCEEIAVCDEALLERYLEAGDAADALIDRETISALVAQRRVFPCYFGSALREEGVEELLDGLCDYSRMPDYPSDFGARVYKISRDEKGCRLTCVKITGGTLRVKQTVCAHGGGEARRDGGTEEKVDQIRVYSGSRYTVEQEAAAGTVCALAGPLTTFCGEGLGAEQGTTVPLLAPVMTYRIALPEGCDVHQAYQKLCQLEEEEPQLHIVWRGQTGELQAQLMGEVQIEILQNMIEQRYGLAVGFDEGSIAYRETIAAPVEGVGHYEPLRHYAEVHLLLEPGEPGSGLVFASRCSEDMLDRNWQRLVLTHLREKEHPGVLTGSPITDMRITLVAGRAHLKHTEGGDFRQATYRAVRQGLCRAQSILLEPVYAFRMELPAQAVGRGMTDMQNRGARFGAPETAGDRAVLTGTVPASQMAGYQAQMQAYSGGQGRLYTELAGYEPCRSAEEVIEKIGYDAAGDIENPCGSVFCAHGAGFAVEWDEVESYMHVESVFPDGVPRGESAGETDGFYDADAVSGPRARARESGTPDFIAQEEIDEIMDRTYGSKARRRQGWERTIRGAEREKERRSAPEDGGVRQPRGRDTDDRPQEEYLLVDGYNIIFAWEELRGLAKENLDSARGRLMDILCNYQGCRGMRLILVFDAYKVRGNPGSTERYHNIDVVYTKEAETADQYIEKVTREIGRKHRVRVATSDGLEQLIIMGAGAVRVSAGELREEIAAAEKELRGMPAGTRGDRNYLMADVTGEVEAYIERTLDGS